MVGNGMDVGNVQCTLASNCPFPSPRIRDIGISNNIHCFLWNVITYTCSDFNGGLTKPPSKLAHVWVITSHCLHGPVDGESLLPKNGCCDGCMIPNCQSQSVGFLLLLLLLLFLFCSGWVRAEWLTRSTQQWVADMPETIWSPCSKLHASIWNVSESYHILYQMFNSAKAFHFAPLPTQNGKIIALKSRQNGCHFAADIFKWIFLNKNVWVLIEISLKFVSNCPIDNIPALVQIMAWRRPGDKPLSEPMVAGLLMHICVNELIQYMHKTNRPSIWKRHFQMHFREWKLLYFCSNFTKLCSNWSNWQ